jgi:hypothetical protein
MSLRLCPEFIYLYETKYTYIFVYFYETGLFPNLQNIPRNAGKRKTTFLGKYIFILKECNLISQFIERKRVFCFWILVCFQDFCFFFEIFVCFVGFTIVCVEKNRVHL